MAICEPPQPFMDKRRSVPPRLAILTVLLCVALAGSTCGYSPASLMSFGIDASSEESEGSTETRAAEQICVRPRIGREAYITQISISLLGAIEVRPASSFVPRFAHTHPHLIGSGIRLLC